MTLSRDTTSAACGCAAGFDLGSWARFGRGDSGAVAVSAIDREGSTAPTNAATDMAATAKASRAGRRSKQVEAVRLRSLQGKNEALDALGATFWPKLADVGGPGPAGSRLDCIVFVNARVSDRSDAIAMAGCLPSGDTASLARTQDPRADRDAP